MVGIIPFAPRSHTQPCLRYRNRPAQLTIVRTIIALTNFGREDWIRSSSQLNVMKSIVYIIIAEYKDLQDRVKDSLEKGLKDYLKHDWLEDGLNFNLMKYYIDLSWTRMVNAPMGRGREPMEGMDEILKVPGAGRKCVKILVEGVYFFGLGVLSK